MSADWPDANWLRKTLDDNMGLTALDVVHGFTIPQLIALYGGGEAAPSREAIARDPAALRPGERVLTSAQLAERIARKKEKARG